MLQLIVADFFILLPAFDLSEQSYCLSHILLNHKADSMNDSTAAIQLKSTMLELIKI